MKKPLLLSLLLALCTHFLHAQVDGTFIVTDNNNRMSSCQDTAVSLYDIVKRTGLRDLNDPNDDYTKYRMKRLNGSVITEDVIAGPVKYSDYPTIYIEKPNTLFNGHNGVVIFFNIIDAPDTLFKKDTLTYTVDKGAKINIVQDFFANIDLWSSGLDSITLDRRIFYKDMAGGPEQTIKDFPSWSLVGKGLYKYRIAVAVCGPNDLLWDSIFVHVKETLCNTVEIKNLPSICRDATFDITPYIYLNGQVATSNERSDMTFWDRSNIFKPTSGGQLNPQAIKADTMWNPTTNFPNIEIIYQPNVDLGTCKKYNYMPATKVPSKFITTGLVITKDNAGNGATYTVDGNYYSFNNVFAKNKLKKLYLDNYTALAGTVFNYYNDNQYQNPVTGADLAPGDYYLLATNPDCSKDSSKFTIKVKERDFDITWQSQPSLGKGYYVFSTPAYSGATYAWFAWGGSIVSGSGTNQVTVYYSENAAKYVTISCEVTLTTARTAEDGKLGSALYLNTSNDGTIKEITNEDDVVTDITEDSPLNTINSTIYPNPSEGSFAITGNGVYSLKIFDTLGQTIYSDEAYSANSSITLRSKGVFVVSLSQNNQVQTLKAVLK